MSPLLEVHDLRSGYAGSTVLDGVDLSLTAGSALGLLGRNGAGKSTLIMTLMGLASTTSGTVTLDGAPLPTRPHRITRTGVALVPQGRRIWPPLTVGEHLKLATRHAHAGIWTRKAVLGLLPRLAERLRQPAGSLSGGEQQMLAIARALQTNPRLVLLDEPSDGLAPAVIESIVDAIGRMRAEGVAVLLAEQNLDLAFSVCDEIAVLDRGVIAHHSDTAAFRADPEAAHRLPGVSRPSGTSMIRMPSRCLISTCFPGGTTPSGGVYGTVSPVIMCSRPLSCRTCAQSHPGGRAKTSRSRTACSHGVADASPAALKCTT
ncbi:ABC transporter ATP-binding protein [Kibdelosporangium phytohabitans]|uniref:ABC transporter ATP-binding protein n=1 Tax=Kibdelosporangium phytohabitans TaxID=860235 RepID=UPI0009FAB0BA|nr:ABC transporter ATP-binding protein [Kibdelosporangium phytohabitans]MBE1469992.1 branched-chain amino acid transport system ATP-binding protein [Kibdelosporangium phytohabitans]